MTATTTVINADISSLFSRIQLEGREQFLKRVPLIEILAYSTSTQSISTQLTISVLDAQHGMKVRNKRKVNWNIRETSGNKH